MNENKDIMSTKIELTLKQSQQGVSNDVLVFTVKMEILLEPTSNKLSVGINDGVTASFHHIQIHYHMLMLKLQRHTISIKIHESRKRERRLNFARVLIKVEARKEFKKEIGVVYKGNSHYEKFTKKIQVGEVRGINDDQNMNKSKSYAERPFIVNMFNNRKGNNGKWGYRKKQDNGMGNSSGKNEISGNNKGETSSSVNRMDASTYNRYTLLNELIDKEELILSIEERNVVDEYMNKEKEGENIDRQGWSKEIERYYKDRKELFDVAKEVEIEEGVEEELQDEGEESGLRNETSEEDENILV
nr:hypothetical protein [Tanacetum cinerariifolium]